MTSKEKERERLKQAVRKLGWLPRVSMSWHQTPATMQRFEEWTLDAYLLEDPSDEPTAECDEERLDDIAIEHVTFIETTTYAPPEGWFDPKAWQRSTGDLLAANAAIEAEVFKRVVDALLTRFQQMLDGGDVALEHVKAHEKLRELDLRIEQVAGELRYLQGRREELAATLRALEKA